MSGDIMASLGGVHVHVGVCVNNFSDESTKPRDMLFVVKDTLSIEDDKLFKASRSVHLFVSQSHYKWGIPTEGVKISTLYHNNFSLTIGRISLLSCIYVLGYK